MPPEIEAPPVAGAAASGIVDQRAAVKPEVNPSEPSGQACVTLRPYQADVIEELRRASLEHRRLLLVMPTGAGKTVVASAVVRGAVDLGNRLLFLAHRRELIHQTVNKLWDHRIDAGVILAGHPTRPDEPVQVASVQTLWHRAFRGSAIEKPRADVVIVDEAHHVRARTYERIIASYPEALVIGMTATPCRGDGRGLGNAFDRIVECPSVEELIRLGYLVGTRVYAPSTPDLQGIRVERGDYVERQLAERVDTPELVGDIVEHWHRLGENRKTVVFATGVAHSVHIRDEFRRSGIWSEHIDGTTPTEERDAILEKLSAGLVQVVCNCMVLTEGWDQPDVSCLVLARPTKSLGLFRQMVGRVLRPAPGKVDALILDHSGAVFHHGFAEDPVVWTLSEDKRAEVQAGASRGAASARELKTCPECSATRMSGKPCPACGWQPRQKAQSFDVVDGDLAHVARDGRVNGVEHDRLSFYRQLLGIADERGYRSGFAAHKFKEKFGSFPPRSWPKIPEEPTASVRAWVRSRQIAYAKARQKAAGIGA